MNEAEYVVPPSNGAPNVSGSAPKPPKQPNKVVAWVKSNVATTIAGSVMAIIVILFGVAVVTNQKLEIGGISLNPLYQQAGCDPTEGCVAEAFAIEGQFADGTVNTPYTQNFSVNPQTFTAVGGATGLCTWTVDSINPKPAFDADFIFTQGGPGTTATFRATPTAAGTYNVTIKVSCNATGQTTTKTLPWVVKGPSTDLTIESAFEPATLGETYFSKLKAVNAGDANCTFSFVSSTPEIGNGVIDTSYRNPDGSIMVDQIKFVGNPQTPGDYNITIGVECTPKVGDGPTKTATKTFKLKVNDVAGIAPGTTGLALTANLPDGIVGAKYTGNVNTVHVGAVGATYTCRATVKNISPAISGAYVINAYAMGGELSGTFITTPKTAGTYTVTFHAICFSRDARFPVPTVVFDKDFPWKVNAAGVTPPPSTINGLDLTANFANGVVGTPFSTVISSVNGSSNPAYVCNTLTYASAVPPLEGANIAPLRTVASELQGTFTVTPKNAGTYKLKFILQCNPKDAGSNLTPVTKEKEFTWIVAINQVDPVPPTGQLTINGTFGNGKVGQDYVALVSTTNGSATCILELASVTPAISGATLETVAMTNSMPGNKMANFKAKPTTAGTYAVKITATCPPAVGNGPTTYAEKTFTWVVDPATVTGGGGTGGGGSGSGGSGSGSGGSGGSGGGSSNANVCSTYSNKLIPVYRWWNDAVKDHFYTINANEKPAGYISEGISAYVFSEKIPGSTALYRSNNASLTAHYYSTTDDAEKYGYKTEGILGYVFSSSTTGTVPWYRMHKGWPANDYLETISTKETAEAKAKLAYEEAGIAAYLCGSK